MATLHNTTDSSDAQTAVGGVPALNDTVIYSEPGPSIVSNLSAYSNSLTEFHETRNFAGDIGTASTGLDLLAATIRLDGSGSFGHFTGSGNTWPALFVNPGNRLRELVFQTITAWTKAGFLGGVSRIKASVASIATLTVGGGSHTLEGVTGTNAVTTLTVGGAPGFNATVDSYRKITTLNVGAGGVAKLHESYISPTTVNVWPGGRLVVRNAGTITTLNTYPGSVIDYSQLGRDISIGTWNSYGPCSVIRPSTGVNGWRETEVTSFFIDMSGATIEYKNA